jgi:glycosyltransferase involved in cell wall biosynthesis
LDRKEAIKNRLTAGKEYFLYVGAIHPRKNLMNLLKAFSVFKKRQKSNMQLLIAGRLAWDYENFIDSLKSYKYRQDVQLLGYLQQEELANIMGAAYSLVYPSFFEGFGAPIAEAMQSGVPVITSNTSSMPEVAGSAALLAAPHSFHNLADQMMLIFKDETLRKELIVAGLEQAKKFNWDQTTTLLWNSILQALESKKYSPSKSN